MASRVSLIQSRSIYVGTLNSVAPSDGNLIVTGNVGIGTTSPGATLDVAGQIRSYAATGQIYSYSTVSSNTAIVYAGWTSGSGMQMGYLPDTAQGYIENTYPITSGQVFGDIYFRQNSAGTMVTRMTIKADGGNVGIGTTSPGYKLDVVAGANSTYPFIVRNAGNAEIGGIYSTSAGAGQIYLFNASTVATVKISTIDSSYFTGGNVGIGTTSPGEKLVVNASSGANSIIYAATDTGQAGLKLLAGTGSTNRATRLDFLNGVASGTVPRWTLINDYNQNGTNDFRFVKDDQATSVLTLLQGGNVGIGTTSPNVKLHISGGSVKVEGNSTDQYFLEGVRTGVGTTIRIYDNANTAYIDSYDNMAFRVNQNGGSNGTFRFGGGNLGIGTTSPTQLLSVAGNTDLGNSIGSATSSTYTTRLSGYALYYDASNRYGNYGVLLLNADSGWTASSRRFMITNGYNANRFAIIRSVDSTTDPALGYGGSVTSGTVDFEINNAGAATFGSSVTTVGAIQSGGDIIIQNTYPRIQLIDTDHNSDFAIINNNGNFSIYDDTNSSHRLWIDPTGNVGIGTTAPTEKVDIRGVVRVSRDGVNDSGILAFGNYLNGAGYYDNGIFRSALNAITTSGNTLHMSSYEALAFTTSPHALGSQTIRMYIPASTGNVGIGTTSPSEKLQVNGSIYVGAGSGGSGTPTQSIFQDTYGGRRSVVYVRNSADYASGRGSGYGFMNGNGTEIASIQIAAIDATQTTYDLLTYTNGAQVFGAGSTARMVITSGGNVGIGTTAPNGKLDVYAPSNPSFFIRDDSSIIRILPFGGITYFQTATALTTGSTTDLYFSGMFGTPVNMVIKGSGNVGIGTTSPSDKLDVFGNQFLGDGTNNAQLYIRGVFGVSYAWAIKNLGSGLQIVSTSPSAGNGVNFDFGGNVGIGTTSPSEKLHVDGNVIVTYNNSFQGINSIGNKAILARVSPTTGIINYAEYATAANLNGFVLGSDDARVKGDIATDSLDFITNTSSRMFINSSGNVGIGTTSPSEKLHVVGVGRFDGVNVNVRAIDGTIITKVQSQTVGATQGAIGTESNNDLAILTNNTARMLVTAAGNVGIGTTTPSYKLDVVGDARITSGSLGVGVAPNATDGRIDASNDIVAYSTSDQRLKENVTPIENALEKVKTLTGVEFDWKEETAHVHGYHGHDVGIIAQDVQAVLPEAVRTNESGYLSVRYEKMIALLIEANKELAARVEFLEQKLKQ